MIEPDKDELINLKPETPGALKNIYRFFIVVTGMVGVAHLIVAQRMMDGTVFQRFGAFIIAMDLAVFALIRFWLTREKARKKISPFEHDFFNQAFAGIGIIYAVIGTLIWGYGDMIPIFN